MVNQIEIIREKLRLYWTKYIEKDFLEKILKKLSLTYSITDISRKKIITPLKRGKIYINNLSNELEDPFKNIDLYFEWKNYMFWWLWIYNMYWFSTQVVNYWTVYNTSFSWKRKIWNIKFIFIKQRESFFYWSVKKKNLDCKYIVMSPERVFIQLLKEWKIFKEIPKNIDKKKILKMSEKFSSKKIFEQVKNLCL